MKRYNTEQYELIFLIRLVIFLEIVYKKVLREVEIYIHTPYFCSIVIFSYSKLMNGMKS